MKPSILQVAITTHNAWLHKVLSFLLNLCNLIPFGGSSVEKKKRLWSHLGVFNMGPLFWERKPC